MTLKELINAVNYDDDRKNREYDCIYVATSMKEVK
jgi:hypothetical protein